MNNTFDRHTAQILLIADDELPPDHDWLAFEVEGQPYLVVKNDKATGEVISQAGAGLERLTG